MALGARSPLPGTRHCQSPSAPPPGKRDAAAEATAETNDTEASIVIGHIQSLPIAELRPRALIQGPTR